MSKPPIVEPVEQALSGTYERSRRPSSYAAHFVVDFSVEDVEETDQLRGRFPKAALARVSNNSYRGGTDDER